MEKLHRRVRQQTLGCVRVFLWIYRHVSHTKSLWSSHWTLAGNGCNTNRFVLCYLGRNGDILAFFGHDNWIFSGYDQGISFWEGVYLRKRFRRGFVSTCCDLSRTHEQQILSCWAYSFVTFFYSGLGELFFYVLEWNLVSVWTTNVGNSGLKPKQVRFSFVDGKPNRRVKLLRSECQTLHERPIFLQS